jgi:hypothetical protein
LIYSDRYKVIIKCLGRFQLIIIHLPKALSIQWLHKKLNASISLINLQATSFVYHSLQINLHRFSSISLGFLSIGWCGHLVDLAKLLTSLTFFGGLKSNTISLYLTDIAHHHLGVGILFVLSTHLYLSLNQFSLNKCPSTIILKRSTLNKSLDLQLSLVHTATGYMTSVVTQHIYSLRAYQYLSYHYITTLALYVHHQYIASFLMMAVLSHTTIYLIRDYTIIFMDSADINSPKYASQPCPQISHLTWICLYLGFHSSCVYIHNDTIVAFGSSSKQILIEAVFASIIQESSSKIITF